MIKKPGDGWEAHHIVTWGMNRILEAGMARDILSGAGIDINSAANLVWLPKNMAVKRRDGVSHLTHQNDGLHSNVALRSIYYQLSAGNASDIKLSLQAIKVQFTQGIKTW